MFEQMSGGAKPPIPVQGRQGGWIRLDAGTLETRAVTCAGDGVGERDGERGLGAPASQRAPQQVAPGLLDGQRRRLECVLALPQLFEAQLEPSVHLQLLVQQRLRQLNSRPPAVHTSCYSTHDRGQT